MADAEINEAEEYLGLLRAKKAAIDLWIVGLTTIPYTVTAVQNTVLYGCGLYHNITVLTKFRLVTVRGWLQTAILWCFMVVRVTIFTIQDIMYISKLYV